MNLHLTQEDQIKNLIKKSLNIFKKKNTIIGDKSIPPIGLIILLKGTNKGSVKL